MSVILDSSVTLAWVYPDETTVAIRKLFDAVTENGAVVPALWRIEVANALTIAMRRGRIDAGLRAGALNDLAVFDIRVDDATAAHAWDSTLQLADRFRLTVYDATYLELAHRRSLPLATLDTELSEAARSLGAILAVEP